MSRIFLSHASKNNDSAVALRDWLVAQGWDDVFLDLDPQRGIAAGERWERSLNQAALRCEAVLFLVSRAWLASDWCLKEFNLAHRLNKRLFGLLIDDIPIGDLPATLTGTWQLVPLASGRDHIMLRVMLPGTQDEVHVTFSKEGLTRLRVGLERAGLDTRFFTWPPEDDPKRPPYRGLLPLEAADAGIFFGREAPTIEALDRIRGIKDGAAPRLLVLLGASGAGKSSFLRAGLLPRLVRDDRNYLTLPVIRPERAAINGEAGLLRSLEAGFAAHGVVMPRAEIRRAIEDGAAALRPLLQTLSERARTPLVASDANAKAPVLVLAIDQGEELFLTDGALESTALLNLLRELLVDDAPALLFVITIRSDAYEQLQTARALEGVTQQPLSLIPMPRGAYQAVIEGPAGRLKETDRSLVIEPALTQALLSDIEDGGGRDALPLLAFTLERLYLEYGTRGRLTLKDYDALGRIRGSIEAAVERAFRAADNDARIPHDRDARLALLRRGLIPWLAGIDPDTGSPRRHKARISEIPEEARPLIDLLVEQRLLSTDITNDTGERTIEPAHESLLRQWGSLQGWLQEDFAALTNLETVKRAARDWTANAKGEDWLGHRASRLEDAERLLQRPDLAGNLGATDRAYLTSCREREETERKEKTAALERRLRLQRRMQLGAIAAILLLATIATAAGWQWRNAVIQRNSALVTQSRFLADLADQRANAGDAASALSLALAAVPDKHEDIKRPESPEAEAALLGARQRLREIAVLAVDGVWSAQFSTDGQKIFTTSSDGTARIWNSITAKTLFILGEKDPEGTRGAISLDGRLGVTTGFRGPIRFWDTQTGKQVGQAAVHPYTDRKGKIDYPPIGYPTFSPDGRRLVTASGNTARVWDSGTGAAVGILAGHDGYVLQAAFSSDGRKIVTASSDKTARVWDAESGKLLSVLVGHEGDVLWAEFSPDSRRVLTLSKDNTARIWDIESAKVSLILAGNTESLETASFSPDGRRVLTILADKTAQIWNADTGKTIVTLSGHIDKLVGASFSPDGSRVVTASEDSTARLWSTETGALLAVLVGHTSALKSAAFSSDGRRLVTTSGDNTARIWNAEWAKEFGVLAGHAAAVRTAAFSADGHRILTASDDKTARVWDADTGKVVVVLEGHVARVTSASFSPDGRRVLTASPDRTARIWNVDTGSVISVLLHDNYRIGSAAFSPDGRWVITGSDSGGLAQIWNAENGDLAVSLKGGHEAVDVVQFSADGLRALTGSAWTEQTARLWDTKSGAQLAVFRAYVPSEENTALSPDGKTVVTESATGPQEVQIWDADSSKVIASLGPFPYARPTSVAFSPDGRLLAIAFGTTVVLWDTKKWMQVAVLKGHDSRIKKAAFSHDGTRVVTASEDRTARVWDIAGKAFAVLRGHSRSVNDASFSPDGNWVVTASDDGTARIWRLFANSQLLADDAQRTAPRCLTLRERERAFLNADPPAWCIELEKWPYQTQGWRDWLRYKHENVSPPFPDTPEWKKWLMTRSKAQTISN